MYVKTDPEQTNTPRRTDAAEPKQLAKAHRVAWLRSRARPFPYQGRASR